MKDTSPHRQRRLWQWVVMLIVVAIGVVGLLLVMNRGSSEKNVAAPNQNSTSDQTTNTNNNTTQSMHVEILKEGSGPVAKSGDTVTVNYTGTLTDGTKFDSSLNPGRTPFQFTIGPDCQKNNTCVIEGWNVGVTGMKVGEKRKLTIPPELAYGPGGAGDKIPPNSTLIFEVELLKIN